MVNGRLISIVARHYESMIMGVYTREHSGTFKHVATCGIYDVVHICLRLYESLLIEF